LARIETAAGTAGMALKVWRAIARTARQPSSPFWRDDSPRRGANVGTYAWFGGPVQEGALKIGIKDGFLTLLPERPMASTKGALIPEVGDQADGEAKTRISVEAETNRIIGIPEQELSRERKFMGRIDQGPKALVLGASPRHAAMVRDMINLISGKRFEEFRAFQSRSSEGATPVGQGGDGNLSSGSCRIGSAPSSAAEPPKQRMPQTTRPSVVNPAGAARGQAGGRPRPRRGSRRRSVKERVRETTGMAHKTVEVVSAFSTSDAQTDAGSRARRRMASSQDERLSRRPLERLNLRSSDRPDRRLMADVAGRPSCICRSAMPDPATETAERFLRPDLISPRQRCGALEGHVPTRSAPSQTHRSRPLMPRNHGGRAWPM
jgi:hypothetical protein